VAIGWFHNVWGDNLGQKFEKRAVKINGAVSPAARAIARVTPVIMAGIAAGITTFNTVW
jgi:hypothetical protein